LEVRNVDRVIVKAKAAEVSIANETRMAINLPDMCVSF
jgi:hypothetical protein